MTQQRSNETIRADLAAMDASAMWSDRYHDALIRVLHDVEPLLARAERAEAERDGWERQAAAHYHEARALRSQIREANAELAMVRSWAHTRHGGIKSPAEVWPGLAAALAAGLSLQEERGDA